MEVYGIIPNFDDDGHLNITTITPEGANVIKETEYKQNREGIVDIFRDRPVGSIATLKNGRGDILEIIKADDSDEGHFDVIHHMCGSRDAVMNVDPTFVVSEIFMGQYDWDTLKTDCKMIDDPSPMTVTLITNTIETDRKGRKIQRVQYKQIFPNGETRCAEQSMPLPTED